MSMKMWNISHTGHKTKFKVSRNNGKQPRSIPLTINVLAAITSHKFGDSPKIYQNVIITYRNDPPAA